MEDEMTNNRKPYREEREYAEDQSRKSLYENLIDRGQKLALELSNKTDPSRFDDIVEKHYELSREYIQRYKELDKAERSEIALFIQALRGNISDKVDILRVREMRSALVQKAKERAK